MFFTVKLIQMYIINAASKERIPGHQEIGQLQLCIANQTYPDISVVL